MSWRISGQKFSWSRDQDGKLVIWLYPAWHVLAPNFVEQYPVFEYDEVMRLNGLEAYVIMEPGDGTGLINHVKDNHRWTGYSPEPGEPSGAVNVMASLIDNKICLSIQLKEEILERTLADLLAVSRQSSGYYLISTGDLFVDLTQSFGLRPDAKQLFLNEKLPALVIGNLKIWHIVGEELQPSDKQDESKERFAGQDG